ncbi:serine hydrolase family protein [Candidatus Peregrinibacteria bacterium]|nr:serine hydrolase family protein [Candidatus Peregrinibacteria bacterium]
MPNILIVHGKENTPDGNWFPWLKTEMEKLGHKVFAPKFPTPENQTLGGWMDVFEEYKEFVTPDSIVVGHSLGAPFLLNILEKTPVRAAFFVAGFVDNPVDPTVASFCRPFDWGKIRANCPAFYVFHSDNDPYFGLEKGDELVRNLNTDLIFVKGAGHFNLVTGYDRFDLLAEKMKDVCQKTLY